MTATAHALVGASIALKISNPAIGLPFAFVSHFVFDKLPHWDVMTNHHKKSKKQIFWQTVADTILGYLIIAVLVIVHPNIPHIPQIPQIPQSLTNLAYLSIFAFVAQLPDWLEIPYMFKVPDFLKAQWNYKLQSWVHDVGFNSRTQAPWGIITQVAVIALFLFWALA